VIRLAVRVSSGQAELVLAELLELAPAGVEEVQGQEGTSQEGTVEYAVYGPPGELPGLPDLHAVVGDALVEISTSEIPDDWHERWRQFHRPVLVQAPRQPVRESRQPSDKSRQPGRESLQPGRDARQPGRERPLIPSLHVRPPWEAPSASRDGAVREIVIDPGQAFGTGGHASTRLCLELLLALAVSERPYGALLDVGTGSGVLAIAAAGLGFRPVLGLDHEQESVDAARENAIVNRVEVEVRRFDLRVQSLPCMDGGTGIVSPTVVVANLLRPLLLELAGKMPRAPAHLLAGGLLTGEVDEVVGAFADRLGLRERERRERGEWAAVWLAAADQPPSALINRRPVSP
jgi:ribosomal protein L11 methyltransferase